MAQIKSALALSSVSGLASKVLGFVAVVTFSRMLTPAELGVFAIASTVIALASEFRLLGTSTYLIREKTLTPIIVAQCIGAAIIVSWTLGISLIMLAPYIGSYYGYEQLGVAILILTPSFFLAPFMSSTHALLERQLKYGRILAIQVTDRFVALTTSLVLITQDFGIYALAIGETAATVSAFVLARALRPSGMLWNVKFRELGSIFSVGIYTSGISIASRLELSMVDLVLGKFRSPSDVAIMSRAIGLHVFLRQTLSGGISGVALPYLSSALRSDDEKNSVVRRAYLTASDLTIVFLAPPAIVASFAAQPLIHTLFGDQWDNAVNVAEVLGLWMVLKVLMFFSMPTLISLRLEKRLFFVRIGLLFVQFMFLIIAAKYGVIYVAVGLSMAACVQIFAESRLIFDAFGLRLTDYLLYCRRSAYVCIATLLTCFLVRLVPLDGAPPVFTLLIYALSNTVTWLLALYAFRHPLSVHVTALAASISSSLTLRR